LDAEEACRLTYITHREAERDLVLMKATAQEMGRVEFAPEESRP